MRIILSTIVLAALWAAPGQAQDGDDAPKGTVGSGLITGEQITESLAFHLAVKEDIVVHFILPKGWELVEEGIDQATGKLREDLGVYTLLSRSPVASPEEPTDFIFELDIYQRRLEVELPADMQEVQRKLDLEEKVTKEERQRLNEAYKEALGIQFTEFLSVQDTVYIRGGLKRKTKLSEAVSKSYGPETRPKTGFVPIRYQSPEGAMLYTFTSFTADTVWQVKFLVTEGQISEYGALIALILDNTFALTDEEFEEMSKNR
ncbi:hypothetical protein IIA79_00810 [bacterium]|nr:hypothetical protein [bacterium]